MYNAIANCNKLIEEIQKKDGTFFPLGKAEKDLIEGEALPCAHSFTSIYYVCSPRPQK